MKDILLAEAEMVFESAAPGEIRGQLAFRSDKPDPTDPILTFAGATEDGTCLGQRPSGEEVDEQLIDALGLVMVHPVRRVGQAFHAVEVGHVFAVGLG